MRRYFSINGYYADDKTEFEGYIVTNFNDNENEDNPMDNDIFFYGLSEYDLQEAIKDGEDTGLDFVITSYEEVIMNPEEHKRNQVELHLTWLWSSIGMDRPENHEEIVEFCYNDVCETADKDNWHSGDVIIAFRRWIEAQAKEVTD
tara:strand:+ start:290 stop:727 length:438 start_codon:yes stop_codon:yes gene_type:complete